MKGSLYTFKSFKLKATFAISFKNNFKFILFIEYFYSPSSTPVDTTGSTSFP